VAEIAEPAVARHASPKDAAPARALAGKPADALMRLADISAPQWRALAMRAAEPNGYYLPDWELAIDSSARGRVGAFALGAWSDTAELIGLLPVISMWRAYKIPLPALVSADPYGTLSTPLLDRDHAEQAAAEILRQARRAGAHALVLRDTSLEGPAMQAFTEILRRDGIAPRVLHSHVRAALDAAHGTGMTALVDGTFAGLMIGESDAGRGLPSSWASVSRSPTSVCMRPACCTTCPRPITAAGSMPARCCMPRPSAAPRAR